MYCTDCGKHTRCGSRKTLRCMGCQRKHTLKLRRPQLPMVAGDALIPGEGDRKDNCRHYGECLFNFCNRSRGDGHCAPDCRYYEAVPHRIQLLTGVDWSAYPGNVGW